MEFADMKIKVPKEMTMYLSVDDQQTELERNAMILYPYIKNLTISHGRAAEILGINKLDLIALYSDMGLAYLDMSMEEIEEDVATYRRVKGAQG
jgi:hypothetical protein